MFHGVKKSLKHFFARITEIDQPIARVHILYPALNIKMQLQGSNACGARTGAVGSGGSVHFLCNTTGTVHVDAKLVYKGYNLQLVPSVSIFKVNLPLQTIRAHHMFFCSMLVHHRPMLQKQWSKCRWIREQTGV